MAESKDCSSGCCLPKSLEGKVGYIANDYFGTLISNLAVGVQLDYDLPEAPRRKGDHLGAYLFISLPAHLWTLSSSGRVALPWDLVLLMDGRLGEYRALSPRWGGRSNQQQGLSSNG